MPTPTPLQILCFQFAEAKQAEAIAKAKRLRIEAELLALVGSNERGQKTVKHGGCVIKTYRNYANAIDLAKFATMAHQFPGELNPIRTKQEANEPVINRLRNERPDLYSLLATALTITPLKSSVSVVTPDAQ